MPKTPAVATTLGTHDLRHLHYLLLLLLALFYGVQEAGYRWDEMGRKETDCDFFLRGTRSNSRESCVIFFFSVFALLFVCLDVTVDSKWPAEIKELISVSFFYLSVFPRQCPPLSLSLPPLSLFPLSILLSLLHGRRRCGVDEAITHAGTVT